LLITFFLTDWQHVIEQQRLITSKQAPKFRRKSAFFPQNRMALTYEPDRENPGDSGDEIVSVSTEAGIGKHLDRNSTAPAHDLNRVRQALRKLKGLLRACQPLAIYLPTPCQPLAKGLPNPMPVPCKHAKPAPGRSRLAPRRSAMAGCCEKKTGLPYPHTGG